MKIILCGKGGCGKSTVATLLARVYQKAGKNVLVIDSDESNYGLHRQLGFRQRRRKSTPRLMYASARLL